MFKVITTPFDPITGTFKSNAFNEFIADKEVTFFQPQFFNRGDKFYWSVFIQYQHLEGSDKGKFNLKENSEAKKEILKELTEEQFTLFKSLKGWRMEKAKQEGIPPFIVLKDEQLIEIIKTKPESLESLKNINGIGDKKAQKYGQEILNYFKKDLAIVQESSVNTDNTDVLA